MEAAQSEVEYRGGGGRAWSQRQSRQQGRIARPRSEAHGRDSLALGD